MTKVTKAAKPIDGIHCIVENCEYHTTGNGCRAHSIQVGCRNSDCKGETECETFCKCSECH